MSIGNWGKRRGKLLIFDWLLLKFLDAHWGNVGGNERVNDGDAYSVVE